MNIYCQHSVSQHPLMQKLQSGKVQKQKLKIYLEGLNGRFEVQKESAGLIIEIMQCEEQGKNNEEKQTGPPRNAAHH